MAQQPSARATDERQKAEGGDTGSVVRSRRRADDWQAGRQRARVMHGRGGT